VEGSCEYGNELSGSIKCWKFLSSCTICGFSRRAQLHDANFLNFETVIKYPVLYALLRLFLTCDIIHLIMVLAMKLSQLTVCLGGRTWFILSGSQLSRHTDSSNGE
jgi:hypothetical protein